MLKSGINLLVDFYHLYRERKELHKIYKTIFPIECAEYEKIISLELWTYLYDWQRLCGTLDIGQGVGKQNTTCLHNRQL